jgi:hypothetical protein
LIYYLINTDECNDIDEINAMEDSFCDSSPTLAKLWFSSCIEDTCERKDALDVFIRHIKNPKIERNGQLPVSAIFAPSGGGKSHFIDYAANYLHKSEKYYPIVISFSNDSPFVEPHGKTGDRGDCDLAFSQRIIWTYVTPHYPLPPF